MFSSKRRFDLVEVALIVGFAVFVTSHVVKRRDVGYSGPSLVEAPLVEQLDRRYKGQRFSMGVEEWFIRDFFNDSRNGFFVDVGSWDPVRGSNTYRLEHDFGWTGLAVDAIHEFKLAYESNRPKSIFIAAFVGDQDAGTATLHVPETLTAVASGTEAFVNVFTDKSVPRQVPRRTLDSLLQQAGITRIDFLTMDIELGEPVALRGFDIDRFRPRFVCIEAQGETRQAILDYFAAHGYVLVGKYLPHDRVNLYFKPRA